MSRGDPIERKLKRLRSIEAGCRRDLRGVEEALAQGRIGKERAEKLRARLTRRMGRLLARIRELTTKRGT